MMAWVLVFIRPGPASGAGYRVIGETGDAGRTLGIRKLLPGDLQCATMGAPRRDAIHAEPDIPVSGDARAVSADRVLSRTGFGS
jgi:hypothetical protein